MRASKGNRGFTGVELIAVLVSTSLLAALLLPGIVRVRESARRAECTNNLAQLGLALHAYHHTHAVLPPGCVNAAGPVVDDSTSYNFGWLAQLLPYFEESIAYNKLDFTQSAYAAQNQAVGQLRPDILFCPSSVVRRPLISYAGCHHGGEAPIDTNNRGVLFLNSSIRFRDITDGRRYTIMIGETQDGFPFLVGTRGTLRNTSGINSDLDSKVSKSSKERSYYDETEVVPETAPLVVDGKQVEPNLYVGGFRSYHALGANFCLADGAVRFLSNETDQTVLSNLGDRMDGTLIADF